MKIDQSLLINFKSHKRTNKLSAYSLLSKLQDSQKTPIEITKNKIVRKKIGGVFEKLTLLANVYCWKNMTIKALKKIPKKKNHKNQSRLFPLFKFTAAKKSLHHFYFSFSKIYFYFNYITLHCNFVFFFLLTIVLLY